MDRILLKQLVNWRNSSKRKPLVLDGARQVGKTYLLEKLFGETYFNKVFKLDFRENNAHTRIFQETREPNQIIRSLELEFGQRVNLDTDLIFFDEIGECQPAVDSLKYFCEKMPNLFLCASGSNMGLLNSFPVGKTENLELFPCNFYEFLKASKKQILIEEFENQSRLLKTHEMLWQILLDYYYVGGMPEAVEAWFNSSSLQERIERVGKIHQDLLAGYERDFGKYGNKVNALHIGSVYRNVPIKLQNTQDDSVKRLTFKDLIKGKKQYSELRGPIDWLEKSKLVSKNLIIKCQPQTPLIGFTKQNIFKLFYFDVGLLCHSLGISYNEVVQQGFFQKGFIAENFVQNELRAMGIYPTFSWQEGKSEMEFIWKSGDGEFYPLEVKSGKRTKAQSLRVYKEKYKPNKTIKLIGGRGSEDPNTIVWPLYYVSFLSRV